MCREETKESKALGWKCYCGWVADVIKVRGPQMHETMEAKKAQGRGVWGAQSDRQTNSWF